MFSIKRIENIFYRSNWKVNDFSHKILVHYKHDKREEIEYFWPEYQEHLFFFLIVLLNDDLSIVIVVFLVVSLLLWFKAGGCCPSFETCYPLSGEIRCSWSLVNKLQATSYWPLFISSIMVIASVTILRSRIYICWASLSPGTIKKNRIFFQF